jgi:hypothetical protein
LKPSGVSSNTQAKASTGMKPMIATSTTMRTASARPNAGSTVSAIWMASQLRAMYPVATRKTCLRLSS